MEAAAKSDSITLKLIIDTKANKVLFAEASKDFVDFLLFLRTLPIGTAMTMKILPNHSMTGSIENLYSSFESLDQAYLQPNIVKQGLLFHGTSTSVAKASLWLETSVTPSYVFYNAYSCDKGCKRNEATDKGVKCSKCGAIMTSLAPYYMSTNDYAKYNIGDGPDGYVRGLVNYMVYDDLSVRLMSMISSISLMNEVKASHLNVLQEKEVEVGKKEALELLKYSLQSKSVLTDVFLVEKKSTELDSEEKFEGEKKSEELGFQEKLDRYMKEMKK